VFLQKHNESQKRRRVRLNINRKYKELRMMPESEEDLMNHMIRNIEEEQEARR